MEPETAARPAFPGPNELGASQVTDFSRSFAAGSQAPELEAVTCLGTSVLDWLPPVPAFPLRGPTGGGRRRPGRALQDHDELFWIIHG